MNDRPIIHRQDVTAGNPNHNRWPVWSPLLATTLGLLLVATGCDKPSTSSSSRTFPKAQWFEDITEASGIGFQHVSQTNYSMVGQVGSGVALLDYDADGQLDIYLVQNGGATSSVRNALYHQEADGSFRDVSTGSGVDLAGHGMGAYAGDVNNDGLPELLVTEYGATRLLQNLGSGERLFREVTTEAGIDNPHWAAPAGFLDYDRDGWLDMVVGNYVDYDPTQVCYDVHGRNDFCAPGAFAGTVSRIYRNVTGTPGGVPRFEDVTATAGFTSARGDALGLVCADFDGDTWPDVFLADDGRPNRLFINQRDGTFKEEAAIRGLAFNAMGGTAANMGTAFADVDGDGMPDLFVTHLAEEFHSLWKQQPRGLFADHFSTSGLVKQEWRGTGFGTVLADFDHNGHVDLAFANGLVRRLVPGQTPVHPGVTPWWARYAQRAQLFSNEETGFQDLSSANPAFSGQAMVGRTLAVGDLDNDGALDLILANIGGPVRIYRNVAPKRGHWLSLRLLDPAHGNRDAIGAEITLRAGDRIWWGLVQPATSYLASNDPRVHLGLSDRNAVDEIEVLWPDGVKETFPGGPVDRFIVLKKGGGR